MTLIRQHVAAVEEHLSAIADLFSQPTASDFLANADMFPVLERALNLKVGIDAAIAYAADQARAGDRVGSSRTVDYLIKELGLSFPEAMARLRLGHQNHGRVTLPEPTSPTSPTAPTDTADTADTADTSAEQPPAGEQEQLATAAREREEQLRRQRAEQLRQEEAARERARLQARRNRISQEKLKLIDRELAKLNGDACHGRNELYVRAVAQSSQRTPEDLQEWVRTQVRKANTDSRDPHAAWRKRELKIGRPDSDGGANIYGYVTADTLALLESALAPANRPGHLIEDPETRDNRTLPQRRHDALAVILRNHSAEKMNRTGVGTVVVSLSAKDIDNLSDPTADHRFPTNTNAMLSPQEILRLGAGKYNFAVVHDPRSGDPLHVARTERLATLEQRIALLASQLVCVNPDCTQPFCNCEIHHLQAWQLGGSTDIWNLAAMCRTHHRNNNDRRDATGARGHAERDPISGRVGYRPPPRPGNPHPAVEVNESERQSHSGGAKVRAQSWPGSTPSAGPEESGDTSTATGTGSSPPPDPPTQPPLFPRRDVA